MIKLDAAVHVVLSNFFDSFITSHIETQATIRNNEAHKEEEVDVVDGEMIWSQAIPPGNGMKDRLQKADATIQSSSSYRLRASSLTKGGVGEMTAAVAPARKTPTTSVLKHVLFARAKEYNNYDNCSKRSREPISSAEEPPAKKANVSGSRVFISHAEPTQKTDDPTCETVDAFPTNTNVSPDANDFTLQNNDAAVTDEIISPCEYKASAPAGVNNMISAAGDQSLLPSAAVVANAKMNDRSLPSDVSHSNLIPLSRNQMDSLPFPVGCHVMFHMEVSPLTSLFKEEEEAK
jgi:hypothetical protein